MCSVYCTAYRTQMLFTLVILSLLYVYRHTWARGGRGGDTHRLTFPLESSLPDTKNCRFSTFPGNFVQKIIITLKNSWFSRGILARSWLTTGYGAKKILLSEKLRGGGICLHLVEHHLLDFHDVLPGHDFPTPDSPQKMVGSWPRTVQQKTYSEKNAFKMFWHLPAPWVSPRRAALLLVGQWRKNLAQNWSGIWQNKNRLCSRTCGIDKIAKIKKKTKIKLMFKYYNKIYIIFW